MKPLILQTFGAHWTTVIDTRKLTTQTFQSGDMLQGLVLQ